MAGPSSTVDQNILPVQAYFNLDGSFNTFIGQGQPFVVSATESIGIINTSVSGTFYPTFTAVNTGQVTTLSVTSSVYKFNPGTGELSAPFFDGFLNGTASEANNIVGGASSQLLYQTSANTTGFVPNGISGQFLVSNGTSAPSWSSVATSVTIVDQTSSSSTFYPLFYSATSGSTNTVETSSTKLQYVPSTGTFTSTVFSGSGASLTNIPNSALTNSSFTLGSTSISLGSTTTTIAGLTSVTSTTFVGALSGNASTATTATTATNATNIGITDNTSSIATWYPTIVSNTTGNLPATTSSTKLSFVPSTGTLAVANLNLTNALGIAYGGTNSTATPTAGGIGYGTGTAHAYSAIGTSGQVLTSAGAGVPIWTTPTTGTVTSVTGTAPVVSSGGNTPVISMAKATSSVDGYLTSTDWTTFNGKQATLVSGTNIKTVGGASLLGSGDVGTIGVAYGGTGVATLTGFAYGNGTSAFTAATTAQVLTLIGTLPVGNGGTGLTTLTANYIPYGNGTSAFQSSSGFTFDGTNFQLASANTLNWNSDTYLRRDAANTLAQRNSTNAQTFRLYNTYTSTTSFENLQLDWTSTSNVATIGTQVGSGGGTARPLAFSTNATERMRIFTSGGVSIGNTTDAGATNLSVTGSASAASFIPTSATVPTNGMYLPATNGVGFATNSALTMWLSTAGNMYMGTTYTASAYKVQVNGNFAFGTGVGTGAVFGSNVSGGSSGNIISGPILTVNTVPFNLFLCDTTAGTTGTGGGIGFGGDIAGTASGTSAVLAAIQGGKENSTTVDPTYYQGTLRFFTRGYATGNVSERMRISSAGGVSIGNTTDPGAGGLRASGLIYPQQAATASAPAYVKGAIYFDTTLNKLRVGGATAWETITSV